MKTLALIAALALVACGPMVAGPADTVRCAHLDGGFSTVLCSCASSCSLQPDLSIRAEALEGCGETACWQEPQQAFDAGTADAGAAFDTAALLQ